MIAERRDFTSKDDLAKALAEAVAGDIGAMIESTGEAAIAVSGGTTPGRFFAALGRRKEIAWDKVTVTLVDERWVEETSERSNAGLVNTKMLQGPAAVARFLPLYAGGEAPDGDAIARTNTMLARLPEQFAAVVLGMGADGHTASFFPGGDTLDAALSEEGPALAIRAPGAAEARVTLTLKRILNTRGLYLHIEGEEKVGVLAQALEDGPIADMPVRAVLRADHPVTLFWSP